MPDAEVSALPFKLGLNPKQVDARTLRYRDLRVPGPWGAPTSWSWDAEHPGAVPLLMLVNNRLGCCVESESGHFTMRAQYEETGTLTVVTDHEIETAYMAETGGFDNGLVMLSHLKLWRNTGLRLGGRLNRIHSFLEVNPQDPEEIKETSMVGLGLDYGLDLPLSAADQLNAGQDWDLVTGPRGAARSWGGHCVLSAKFDAARGVCFVTWGKEQWASWRWVAAYATEVYMTIDQPDLAAERGPLDTAALHDALANL